MPLRETPPPPVPPSESASAQARVVAPGAAPTHVTATAHVAAPVLVVALAVGLAVHAVLALRPGPGALFPALATLAQDVATHDVETLRREHDGWYARLLPVYAAIDALPPDEALLLVVQGVPPWFVAAHAATRRVFLDSAALRTELAAQQQAYHVLTLTNGDPIGWTLLPGDEAGR